MSAGKTAVPNDSSAVDTSRGACTTYACGCGGRGALLGCCSDARARCLSGCMLDQAPPAILNKPSIRSFALDGGFRLRPTDGIKGARL